jgi:hypothetical protein
MEMSQGDSPCSYLKETKMSLFFGEHEGEQLLPEELVRMGAGSIWGKA